MNVLLIGNGGREHAIALKLAESPNLSQLFITPGNPGTAEVGQNVALDVTVSETVIEFCTQQNVSLVMIGPEEPLVNGLADDLRKANIPTVGPGKAGAQLEGSKQFSKEFMSRNKIPTAAFRNFGDGELHSALTYAQRAEYPLVVKADGLAAGKGVVICQAVEEAEAALCNMMAEAQFGAAGVRVVVEQFLVGIEVSMFVLSDGEHHVLLPSAKDYKRIGVGDTGPNTGGMGSVSPVYFAEGEFLKKVHQRIIEPTFRGLQKEGIPYQGFLFIGLMNVGGEPYVLEYNTRLGDPETQSVLPRIETDFLALLLASAHKRLNEVQLKISPKACVTVVCVSEGYPGQYAKGYAITGLNDVKGSTVVHAGTALDGNTLITSGGRVLGVTTLGDSVADAVRISLENAARVSYTGKYYRADIAQDLMIDFTGA